jgi:WD repeat-containing protein 35
LFIFFIYRDLAIGLRQKLSDWYRTVSIFCMYSGKSDQQIEMAWKEIGNSFAAMSSWENAKEYFEKAQCIEGKIEALYHLEQYNELEQIIDMLPDKHPLHAKLGLMFVSVGMCPQAVSAYMKLSDVKSAVNASISLKQWGLGLHLAQRHKMPQINTLLTKHAAQLKEENRLLEAVELQRKAGRFLDAARLLLKLAEEEMTKKSELLRMKQIFILAGLLAEEYLQTQISMYGTRAVALTYLNPDEATLIEKIWHSSEGYHFLILAQQQLQSGLIHSAMLTSIRLREYENILSVEEIYSLIALTGIADQ